MTAAGADERSAHGRTRQEVLVTVLLVLAALGTSWSSYQATRWNGEQAKVAGRMNAIRIDAARAQGRAADAATAKVLRDLQTASNYVLTVVLYAVVLVFAGMSTKIAGRRLRWILVGIGCLVFVITIAWIATFPVS